MARERRQGLRSCQLSFIGKVLASFSHELSNHLAVIKESAGLMADLVAMGGSSGRADTRQSIETLKSIEHQVNRSSSLCRYLGRFAHRMDRPLSSFGVNETVEELIVLMSRSARQRRISLERDFDDRVPVLESDPLRLQFVIFILLEEIMERLERNGTIIIKTAGLNGAVSVTLVTRGALGSSPDFPSDSDDAPVAACSFELLQETVGELGGELVSETGGSEVRITLPVSRRSGDRGRQAGQQRADLT